MDDLSPESILRQLIRIPSVSFMSNRPIVEFVHELLQPRGWKFLDLPYRDGKGVEKVNFLATPPRQDGSNFNVDLAFVCHTDTVPYDTAWANATEPYVKDGLLHGCGACDVKGFLACLLSAALSIPAGSFGPTMALVLTAEEEIGCIGAKRLIESGRLHARHIVVGEPTGLHPARAGKGYGLAEICISGKEAHSAHPTQGVSAIYHAARLIHKIEEFSVSLQNMPSSDSVQIFDPPYTTLNIGEIQGGSAKNIVPGECKFLLEWRSIPGEPAGHVIDALTCMTRELKQDDVNFSCTVKVLRDQHGFETSIDSPLLQRWIRMTGRSAIAVPFSTEAPIMATVAEDVLVLGPGDMRTAHSQRECVPVRELEQCTAYFQNLLQRPIEDIP